MEADEALHGIPSVRDDVASQGDRSGRLDEREPSGLVLHVGEEIEKAHHKERDGIAHEKPSRCGLNLRDYPMRMSEEEENEHRYSQSHHSAHKLERLLLVAPMDEQHRCKGSRYTQGMMCHVARKGRKIEHAIVREDG